MRLSKGVLKKKMVAQHYRCYYCGDYLLSENIKIEIDHYYPFSKYKDGTSINLVLSCSDCNRKKSDKPLYLLRKYLKLKDKLMKNDLFYYEFLFLR